MKLAKPYVLIPCALALRFGLPLITVAAATWEVVV